MRKMTVVITVLFVATAAHAQKAGTVDVSAFASNPGFAWSESSGYSHSGAFGLSANVFFSPKWSAVLSAERDVRPYTRYELQSRNGIDVAAAESGLFRVFPVDALVRYNFTNDTRWKPYVGAGLNYVARPLDLPARTALEANGGLTFMVTPHLGINGDVKFQTAATYRNEGPQTRTSLGLSWRF